MFQRTTLLQLDTGPKPTNLWVRVTGEHLTITKKIWIHFLVNIEITKCLETQTKSHVLRKNIKIKKIHVLRFQACMGMGGFFIFVSPQTRQSGKPVLRNATPKKRDDDQRDRRMQVDLSDCYGFRSREQSSTVFWKLGGFSPWILLFCRPPILFS